MFVGLLHSGVLCFRKKIRFTNHSTLRFPRGIFIFWAAISILVSLCVRSPDPKEHPINCTSQTSKESLVLHIFTFIIIHLAKNNFQWSSMLREKKSWKFARLPFVTYLIFWGWKTTKLRCNQPPATLHNQGTHHWSIRRRRWSMVRGGLRGSWWNEAARIASRRRRHDGRRHDGRRSCLEATRCARDDWPKILVVLQERRPYS